MSNPVSFMNGYISVIQNLINDLEQARYFNDQLAEDSSIPSRYFATANARTDITVYDIGYVQTALTNLLATFDGGTPPNKATMFKMLP